MSISHIHVLLFHAISCIVPPTLPSLSPVLVLYNSRHWPNPDLPSQRDIAQPLCLFPCTEFGTCPTGWKSYGQYCYQFNVDSKTWSAASLACKAQSAELASVHSSVEQANIALETGPYGTDQFHWLGELFVWLKRKGATWHRMQNTRVLKGIREVQDSGRVSFWGDAYTARKCARNLRSKIRKCVPTKRNREKNVAFRKHLFTEFRFMRTLYHDTTTFFVRTTRRNLR